MKTSPNGIAVMHYFEACKLKAYPDPGSKDGRPWTVGWGDTGPDVAPGLTITQTEADARFAKRLAKEFEPGVSALLAKPTKPVTQGQFDALVCFAYNVGLASLKGSTLLRNLTSGDVVGAEAQFARWNKNDGKAMLGLTRRRVAEQALFRGLTGDQAIAIGADVK